VPPARRSRPRSPEHAALGDAIRRLREQRGLTIEALADLAGTDLTQLGGVERGTRNATYEYLLRIAKALDASVGEMTTLADQVITASAAGGSPSSIGLP
jgi:transcriptional regulator with XRE-family HTH domain